MLVNMLSWCIDQFEGYIGMCLLYCLICKLVLSIEGLVLFECYVLVFDWIFEIEWQYVDGQELVGIVCVVVMVGLFEVIKLEWLVEFYVCYLCISIDFLFDDMLFDLIVECIDFVLCIGIEIGGSFCVCWIVLGMMIFVVSFVYFE